MRALGRDQRGRARIIAVSIAKGRPTTGSGRWTHPAPGRRVADCVIVVDPVAPHKSAGSSAVGVSGP